MKDEVLIVDGYNMIGAWPELLKLRERHLEDARDRLIALLSDYQGYLGYRVIVVFDAHQVPGLGGNYTQNKVELVYTKEKETADSCIERLVTQLINRKTVVTVATNDGAEQHVIFGKGALRQTANELAIQIAESRKSIASTLKQSTEYEQKSRNTFDNRLNHDVKRIFEFWRRGGKD
jgi:predicted RNA-binding protein with PIN domain